MAGSWSFNGLGVHPRLVVQFVCTCVKVFKLSKFWKFPEFDPIFSEFGMDITFLISEFSEENWKLYSNFWN